MLSLIPEALEEKVRKEIPPDMYGIGGYLLSKDHKMYMNNKSSIYMKGKISFNVGYNCYVANHHLAGMMRERDMTLHLMRGKDSKGFFGTHFFCRDDEGTTYDATPLYHLVGESHLAHEKLSQDPCTRIHCVNPWRTYSKGQKTFMLSFDTKSPGFAYNTMTHPFDGRFLIFYMRSTDLDTHSMGIMQMRLDTYSFREEFGVSIEEIIDNHDESFRHMRTSNILEMIGFHSEKDDKERHKRVILSNSDLLGAFAHKISYGMSSER